MKLLITAIGKRVQLLQHLKKDFVIVGVDAGQDIPGREFVDSFYKVPGCKDVKYVDVLLDICRKEQITCLIPLYEREFDLLCTYRKQFEEVGTEVLLSNRAIINVCNEKTQTSIFFEKHRIAHPKVYQHLSKVQLPVIIKPVDGMGSQNIFKATTPRELEFFAEYVPNPIIEECIDGVEYTIDILCDLQGNPIYIVPRLRLEVRSGEVSKSQTIQDEAIIEATTKVIEYLNSYRDTDGIGVRGPLTIQCFKKQAGEIIFLEINPRFGGGVPLSFQAGADYSSAIKAMLKGETIKQKHNFKSVKMLRYDQAIFKEVRDSM